MIDHAQISNLIERMRDENIDVLFATIPMNPAAVRICMLTLCGCTVAETASILAVLDQTVRNYRNLIRRQLGVRGNLAVALRKLVQSARDEGRLDGLADRSKLPLE